MAVKYVVPYRTKGRTTHDAEISGSCSSPSTRWSNKIPEQQAILSVHRMREHCSWTHRAYESHARSASSSEFGLIIPVGRSSLQKHAFPYRSKMQKWTATPRKNSHCRCFITTLVNWINVSPIQSKSLTLLRSAPVQTSDESSRYNANRYRDTCFDRQWFSIWCASRFLCLARTSTKAIFHRRKTSVRPDNQTRRQILTNIISSRRKDRDCQPWRQAR